MSTQTRAFDDLALDPATRALLAARAAAGQPPVWEVPVDKARAGVEMAQAQLADKPRALSDDLEIPVPSGKVPVRLLRPSGAQGRLPVAVYLHGGGWVTGSPDTHDRLARDIVSASGAALAVVHYSRSPEARYPAALEECLGVAAWLSGNGGALGLDESRLALVGDSSGANLAAAAALEAPRRGGPAIRHLSLLYPVLDGSCSSASYEEFAEGPNLTRQAMRWYWDQYAPDPALREKDTVSPVKAQLSDLAKLPPTLVATAEYDVLRDEGEDFARMLVRAGVAVTAARYLGAIHGFAANNALAATPATRALVAQVGLALKAAFTR